MKKKISAILATALISVALIGCGGKYKDGTYTGTGKGAASEIKVEVQVKGGKIDTIKLVDQHETATLVKGVEENMIPEIIKKQGTEGVEVVSGASNSSKGVIQAVDNALKEAHK